MKNKKYKVTIKMKFETSFPHSQTSALKAKEDVIKVYKDIISNDKKLKNLFELPPHIICRAKIYDGRED